MSVKSKQEPLRGEWQKHFYIPWQEHHQPIPAGSVPSIVVVGGSRDPLRDSINALLIEAGFGSMGRGSQGPDGAEIRTLSEMCRRDPKTPGVGIAIIASDAYRCVETRTEDSITSWTELRTSRKDILAAKRLLALMPHERCIIVSSTRVEQPKIFVGVRQIRFNHFYQAMQEIIDHLTEFHCPCGPVKIPVPEPKLF